MVCNSAESRTTIAGAVADILHRYNSEVTGTIIVQCIPILRPFLRNNIGSFSMKRSGFGSRSSTFGSLGTRISARLSAKLPNGAAKEIAKGGSDTIALKKLPDTSETDDGWKKNGMFSPSTAVDNQWPQPGSQRSRKLYGPGRNLDGAEDGMPSLVYVERDMEYGLNSLPQTRLSPPPSRR